MPFHKNLKRTREAKGFTQTEMATKLGIAQASYCQFETGAKSPTVYLAGEIAEILGTTVDNLLNGG